MISQDRAYALIFLTMSLVIALSPIITGVGLFVYNKPWINWFIASLFISPFIGCPMALAVIKAIYEQ